MLIIKKLEDPDEIKKLSIVESKTWGTNDIVPHHIYIAGKFIGGVLLGAYVDEELVGYVFGLPAIYEGKVCHYSHQLAVIPKYRNMGIGAKLKLKQREECIAKGLDLIIWTFDPLQGLNAYFNIRKLSVIARTYLVNHYGYLDDEINKNLPTDRLLAEWWIKSNWVKNRLDGKGPYYSEVKNLVIHVNNYTPTRVIYDIDEDCISIPIPLRIGEIRNQDPQLAIKWRLILREAMLHYIKGKGYTVVDFVKSEKLGYYILLRNFEIR